MNLDQLGTSEMADDVVEDLGTVLEVRDAVDRGDWEFLYRVIFGYMVKDFHRRWVNFQVRNRFTVIAGPRGFGKTITCTKGFVLTKSIKSRERRILLVGKTLPQARKVQREIRLQLQRNQTMKVFGPFFDEESTDTGTELIFAGRQSLDSEPNVSCIGIGSSKIGGHYDTILCEDLVDASNASGRNAELLRSWVLEELMGMLLPGGEMHFVQSRYGPADLWVDLRRTEIFEMMQTPALVDEQGEPSLNGRSIWEDMISTEELRRRLKVMGTPFFLAQYQQDPSALGRMGQIRFRESAVAKKGLGELEAPAMTKICGVDLGASLGKIGARTVFTVAGRVESEGTETHRSWLLDIRAGQWELDEIGEVFNEMDLKWGPDLKFRCEANGVQLLIANAQGMTHEVEPVNTFESRPKRRQRQAMTFNSGAVGYVEGLEDEMQEFWEWPDWYREDVLDSADLALGGLDEPSGGDFDSMTAEGEFKGAEPRAREVLLELLRQRDSSLGKAPRRSRLQLA